MTTSSADTHLCYYDADQYIYTKSGNKISRYGVLIGKERIRFMGGKSIIEHRAVIRGDLGVVNFGVYCLIGENAVIRPPDKRFKGCVNAAQQRRELTWRLIRSAATP